MSLTIAQAKGKRENVKSSATRLKTYIDNADVSGLSKHDLTQRRAKLNELWVEFDNIQANIENIEANDDEIVDKDPLARDHERQRDTFESTYFDTLAKYDATLELITRRECPEEQLLKPTPTFTNNINNAQVRLPKIELPTFSGSYQEWCSFHDTFDSLIHKNHTISTIEKFHYLKSCLRDKAAEVIQAFEITSENYMEAWDLLKERFDNKRWIIQGHIGALFQIPPMSRENHIELRSLLDNVLKHLRALKALKRPTDKWDDLIIHLMVSKLDRVTNKEWQTSLTGTESPTLKGLTDFLAHRSQAIEAIYGKPDDKLSRSNSNRAASHVTAISLSCISCKGNHHVYHCEEFRKLPVDQRFKTIANAHLCKNCLRTAEHTARDCKSGFCRECDGKHHTLLHLGKTNNQVAVQDNSDQPATYTAQSSQCTHTYSYDATRVLLSTVVINVYNNNMEAVSCRALLDCGSQPSFVTQNMVDRLNLKSYNNELEVAGLYNSLLQSQKSVDLRLKSRINVFNTNLHCTILPKITQRLPQQFISRSNLKIPNNIVLADPNFIIPGDIDVLIGADLFWRVICVGQIKSSPNHPTLQKTLFGWVVAGNSSIVPSQSTLAVCNLGMYELNRSLSRFWQLENLSNNPKRSPEEEKCIEHFQEHTCRNREGRFVVRLPIKQEKLTSLGESYEAAKRQFLSLEKRFTNNSDMHRSYSAFMREYEELNHMRELKNPCKLLPNIPVYYLPHHPVIKETSSTTKLRVVFNASHKTNTGISLNDILMIGPTVQQDLISIFTRFRTFAVALVADIAKMYRQIQVHEDDLPLQRILWRYSLQESLKIFELRTVTYGTASASYQAIESLRTLAKEYSSEFPVGSDVILRDFYVDDLTSGANSIDEAQLIKLETSEILCRGGMALRKWASNIPSLRDMEAPDLEFKFIANTEHETRTLGINWNCNSDQIKFSGCNNIPPLKTPTKRSILSRIALIYDPLRLLGPSVVIAKIFMQDLWRLKGDWDESLPIDLHTKWLDFERELPDLNEISIPRAVVNADCTRLEVHGFCDASEAAYGACLYVRCSQSSGEHTVRLLLAKSRVAPLKVISIQKLELCGALLLAQLIEKIRGCLTCHIHSTFLWTDSTIVLHWLQSCARSWTTFVANRVGQIQELTPISQWRHVKGEDNPADLLSRGVMPSNLKDEALWWHGPRWLSSDESKWPKPFTTTPDDIPEKRTNKISSNVAVNNNGELEIFIYFSNFNKMIRYISWWRRYLHNLRSGSTRRTGSLLLQELNETRNFLIKIVQRKSFPTELRLLQGDKVIHKQSMIIKLTPFLDDQGILRVGGRLKNSTLPYNVRHPILLPKNHNFTRLFIQYEHERHFHAGPQATLTAVRQTFWPCSGQAAVRRVTRACVTCICYSPRNKPTLMGELPSSRVETPARPFINTGLDYGGPFYHQVGSRRTSKLAKCYICIFVCFASKAVHIELACDLSTEAFLNAFKRFIARRGLPYNVYSDNGTNFVGASNELSELYGLLRDDKFKHTITKFASNERINWHFIPPHAPHQGGLWEAAIKSAKRHLLHVMQNMTLRFEELQTLIIQVEAILNSRPITPISSNANDLAPLTPGHFLIGDPLTSYPEPSLENSMSNRLSRWKLVERLRQLFWRRWVKEYLHQCQERSKWLIKDGSFKIGQIVLMHEDNSPPLTWQMGRIELVHPGKDGIVRTVTLRTSKGTYARPTNKVHLLPIDSNESSV